MENPTFPQLHIGCSAYNNAYWNGVFYPDGLPARDRFAYYCQHFNAYELNATFYHFPMLRTLQKLYDATPTGFQFAVKAPRNITHFKRFVDCEADIRKFYDRLSEGLRDKLAAVLFQFPPSFRYEPDTLELVLSNLDPGFVNVLEFRHPGWWDQQVIRKVCEASAVFCTVSYPRIPDLIISCRGKAYVRLHGKERKFYSGYGREALADLQMQLSEVEEAFVFFNNTASVEGIIDALELRDLAKTWD